MKLRDHTRDCEHGFRISHMGLGGPVCEGGKLVILEPATYADGVPMRKQTDNGALPLWVMR